MNVPLLITERLILRDFTTDDIEAFAEVVSDKEAMWDLYSIEGAPDDAIGFAAWLIDDAITSWNRSGFGNWAVRANSSDLSFNQRVIGFAGFVSEALLTEDPNEALEVGWGIHPEFGGRGLATEASIAVLDYGFDVMDADKIVAITDHENKSSRRMMERLGMTFSENVSAYGDNNCVLYSITKDQWRK